MNKNIIYALFLVFSFFLNSCSENDTNDPINEKQEELSNPENKNDQDPEIKDIEKEAPPATEDPTTDDDKEEEETPPIMGDVWAESGGILVMECENTKSNFNKWIFNNEITAFSGTGHLRFNEANNRGLNNETSRLKYTFKIETPGNYELKIRASRNPDKEIRPDQANDLFIKMEGDFDDVSAEAIGATGPKDLVPARKNHLLVDRKFSTQFGGPATKIWRWSTRMSIAPHVFRAPWYSFKAGKEYTLTLTGRSKDFVIDRIVFYKHGTNITKWRNAKESKRE